MSAIVFQVRHRIASQETDVRIVHMSCGLRVAMIGIPCPIDPLHLVAMPTCPSHGPITDCAGCR
jgi:hypothetical protein